MPQAIVQMMYQKVRLSVYALHGRTQARLALRGTEDSLLLLENGNERGEIVRRIVAGKASFGTLALRPGEGSREGEYVLRLEAVTASTFSDPDKDGSDTGALRL